MCGFRRCFVFNAIFMKKSDLIGALLIVPAICFFIYLFISSFSRDVREQKEHQIIYNKAWQDCYDYTYKKAVIETYYEKGEYVIQQDHGNATLWKRNDGWKDVVAERAEHTEKGEKGK